MHTTVIATPKVCPRKESLPQLFPS